MSDERNFLEWLDMESLNWEDSIDSEKQRLEPDSTMQGLMNKYWRRPVIQDSSNTQPSTPLPVFQQPFEPAALEPAKPAEPTVPAVPLLQAVKEEKKPEPRVNRNSAEDKSLKFKCDTCSQVFDSKIALSIHTGRIHKHEGKDKNYQCKLCTKAFFNSSYLAQHMRIHTGDKPYDCKECGKCFTQLSHLQQHKRTHTGEKPYRCPQHGCTKAFSQLSNLQSHSRSHLPEGQVHKCSSCYKCYFDETALMVHMKTHLEAKRVRNYKCGVCGKSYTQDTYLQNHVNTKHGGSNFDALGQRRHPTSIQASNNMICKLEGSQALKTEQPEYTRPSMPMPRADVFRDRAMQQQQYMNLFHQHQETNPYQFGTRPGFGTEQFQITGKPTGFSEQPLPSMNFNHDGKLNGVKPAPTYPIGFADQAYRANNISSSLKAGAYFAQQLESIDDKLSGSSSFEMLPEYMMGMSYERY